MELWNAIDVKLFKWLKQKKKHDDVNKALLTLTKFENVAKNESDFVAKIGGCWKWSKPKTESQCISVWILVFQWGSVCFSVNPDCCVDRRISDWILDCVVEREVTSWYSSVDPWISVRILGFMCGSWCSSVNLGLSVWILIFQPGFWDFIDDSLTTV